MKKFGKRYRCLCLGGVLVLLLMTTTACSKGKEGENKATESPKVEASVEPTTQSGSQLGGVELEDVVLKVGKQEVTYRELLIYLLQIKNKYEPSLGSDVWNFDLGDGKSFEDTAKEELLSQISEIKIITSQAEELGIALEEDEKDEVNLAAKAYLEKITKEDQEKYGITLDMVKKVLGDNYLAQKVFSITTNEVDTNISDEQAKQIKLQQIVVLTQGENKDGVEIMLNEEQKKSALERAKKIRENAVLAEEFAAYASANSESECIEFTLGKGDMPEIEAVAFSLKVGDVSNVIETSTGYVILKKISDFDEDATRLKKEEIIEERQNEVFASKYKIWSENYKVTQNMKLWDKITFQI